MDRSFYSSVIIGLFVISCNAPVASTLNILGISTLPSNSHHIWFSELMRGLARNGHNIYALGLRETKFDQDEGTQNRTQSFVFEHVMDNFLKSQDFSPVEWLQVSVTQMAWLIHEIGNDMCERQMATDGAKKALEMVRHTKIDVIVQDLTYGQCFYGMWEIVQGNPAIVGFTPFGAPNWVKDVVGGNNWPAIRTFPYFGKTQPFSIWERTMNFFYYEIDDLLRHFYYMPRQQELAEKFIGRKMTRSVSEIEKNVSIMLTNSYAVLDPAAFSPPNVIEVGGLHIKDSKPLPQDIRKFLDDAEHGAIVISFGSNIQSSTLGSDKIKIILAALGQLKQHVLWKFEATDLPGRPKNVMIRKWLPQNDVLAHPKVRVLWSHSGLLSTQEAVWWGVPLVGMPFYVDQYMNIDLLVKKGVALSLDYESLTTETILERLNRAIHDHSISRRMKELSREYKDRPMSPLDSAVWHVEHASRHPRGPLSSPGKNMSRMELNLFDVYAVLAVTILAILWITRRLVRASFNLFRLRRSQKLHSS
ncbi:UDP-glucosyltransferase 2-like isoform X2 [Neodiprion virginianus]|uniref:UDP-glucosyltransferase 2-like isoform X2 n=1 Tax=Neodiprion virginianus TaxID=2961670 RepID=UPI001EE77B85|nr:UDP-glucosyltransferase 2-like isoform X2 [Neodiprion virginianus]